MLTLATALQLPLEAVTQTFAFLAKRGVGKTYAASVLVEEFLKHGLPVVVLDPLDVWWGLRANHTGDGAGFPIVVLGGSHADLPLQAAMGSALADVVVEEGISAVFSLRHLSKTDQRKFVTDFAERLYDRKGEDENRTPLHIVIDECDAYIPQKVFAGMGRLVGAIDDWVRRGRSSGIGVTLISQRAAVVNKDVLTQIEVLVALRTISPQDRKAIQDWIAAHDAHNQKTEFLNSFASLPIGTAWFWSPGWLEIFQRVQFVRGRRLTLAPRPNWVKPHSPLRGLPRLTYHNSNSGLNPL